MKKRKDRRKRSKRKKERRNEGRERRKKKGRERMVEKEGRERRNEEKQRRKRRNGGREGRKGRHRLLGDGTAVTHDSKSVTLNQNYIIIIIINNRIKNQGSSVSIVARLRAGRPGFDFR